MKTEKKRKRISVFVLAAVFTALQITGWQISMYYHTTVHTSDFSQKFLGLSVAQCTLCSVLVLAVLFIVISLFFTLLEKGYFDMNMHAGGYHDSKMPHLLQFYDKISCEFYYQKIPGLRLLFSIGAMLWVVIFTFGYVLSYFIFMLFRFVSDFARRGQRIH